MVISTHFFRVMIWTSNWNNHFNSWIFRYISRFNDFWVVASSNISVIFTPTLLGGRFSPILTVRNRIFSTTNSNADFVCFMVNVGEYAIHGSYGFDLRTTGSPRFFDLFLFFFFFRSPEEATSFSTTPLEIAEAMEGDEWRIFSEGGRWTHKSYRWWNFKYFFGIFTSKIGEMIQFDQNVTNGWPCFRLNQGFLSNFTNFRMASKGDYDSPFINFVGGSLMKQT